MQITGRTLRLHLVAYSTLSLLLTLGLVVVVAWFPLNHRISSGISTSLRQEVELRARLVDETIKRASDIAWQISSRTAARVTTARYERGLLGREEARVSLESSLRDAVEFSVDARGLLRVDLQDQIIARIGPASLDTLKDAKADYPLLEQPPVRFANRGRQGLSHIFFVGNEPHVLLFTPVFAPDQREVAHDLLLYRLSSLPATLISPLIKGEQVVGMLLGRVTDDRPVELLLQSGHPSASLHDPAAWQSLAPILGPASQVESLGKVLVGASPVKCCAWWLALAAPHQRLHRESRGWLISILATVLGLGLVGLLGSLVLMRPLRDKILVAQDDLRKQVLEMEKVKARLEIQTEKLMERNEDLRHFAYASAHDLKSPLISIGGHAQMLLDRLGPELPPERRQSLEFILGGSKRMFQHVNDMLDYSRAAEIEPKHARLSLERLCQDILASLDGRIRESHATVLLHHLPDLTSDRRLLRMVLQNLIDNALCYRQPDQPPRIEVSAEDAPQEIVIRVKDNGLGIAPDQQPQVFETFYRLHDDAKIPGTGLGLAICLRAVRRLDGTIELDSEPGRGSCFTVRLPHPDPGASATSADEAGLA